MQTDKKQLQEEIDKLTQEIEDFKQEKERVRAIVGQIGSVPVLNRKWFETVFIILLISCLALSLITSSQTLKIELMDVAIAMISIKLLYMIRNQARVSHFQLWILSSLEWRLNEMAKKINNINK